MTPKIWFDGFPIADYCTSMCLVRQGLAGDCWDPCKSLRGCCDKQCRCELNAPGCDCVCLDDQWWVDRTNDCSRDFVGVIVSDVSVTPAYSRDVKATLSGGSFGRRADLPVEITLTGMIIANSEDGTDYGIDVLSQLGARESDGKECIRPDMTIQGRCKGCTPADEEYFECKQDLIDEIKALVPEGYELNRYGCTNIKPPIGEKITRYRLDLFDCDPREIFCNEQAYCSLVDPELFLAQAEQFALGNLPLAFVDVIEDVYETELVVSTTDEDIANTMANLIDSTCSDQAELEELLIREGWAIDRTECEVWATTDVPCLPGVDENWAEAIATQCLCDGCQSTVTYKRVRAKGPIIERESSLLRCCGTEFEWTFAAEVPYKFFGECTPALMMPLRDITYPNWCCGCTEEDPECAEDRSGEESTALLNAPNNSEYACFCQPLFVNAQSVEVVGSELFPTFVNWELTTIRRTTNVQVCLYPDLGGDPLDNPELYECCDPITVDIPFAKAGELIEGDSCGRSIRINGQDGAGRVDSTALIQNAGSGWFVVKSDACNDFNDFLKVSVATLRGAL